MIPGGAAGLEEKSFVCKRIRVVNEEIF